MENNYFIIHGSYGNPYKNWIPWLKKELSKRRKNCIVPNFPTPFKQDFESWSKILKAYLEIDYINENTSFVAHSLGSIFIIKFLIRNNIKIKKLILVSCFNNVIFDDDVNLYNTFYMEEIELAKIKKLCCDITCIYSKNDPYVSFTDSKIFANSINAKSVIIENGGHFNDKFGYKEFKDILNYI